MAQTKDRELADGGSFGGGNSPRAGIAGWFDRLVNGVNRLPRPFLAFGTIGLIVYAMADPVQFARRH